MAIDLNRGYEELHRLYKEGVCELTLVGYGDRDNPDNMAIKAEERGEVIIDFGRPNPGKVDFETELVAIASISHCTEQDAQTLTDWANLKTTGAPPMICYEHGEYGVKVRTVELDAVSTKQLSDDLAKLISAVHDAGYHWLLLDVDGPKHDEFKQFVW